MRGIVAGSLFCFSALFKNQSMKRARPVLMPVRESIAIDLRLLNPSFIFNYFHYFKPPLSPSFTYHLNSQLLMDPDTRMLPVD